METNRCNDCSGQLHLENSPANKQTLLTDTNYIHINKDKTSIGVYYLANRLAGDFNLPISNKFGSKVWIKYDLIRLPEIPL